MIRLRFALAEVRSLAGHAVAAPQHRNSYLEQQTGARAKPALWFVGNEGLYLMSNGLPAQLDPSGPHTPKIVHAPGYLTAADKHTVDHLIGADDFLEVLTLLDPQPDGPALYTQLTEGAIAGATHLVVDMNRTRLELYLARGAARL